ncbi:MAG: leucine-rich repeat protein [Bacteroidaceae bacterium]|nr:leucine-rich repeat protein [Bacteroidaceae bacterium]
MCPSKPIKISTTATFLPFNAQFTDYQLQIYSQTAPAFSGCSNLDYFAFGSSVETIGKEAFSDCVNVTKLISRAGTPPACGRHCKGMTCAVLSDKK